MKLKLKNIFLTACILLGVSGCGLTGSSGGEKENVTTVKMIQAEVFNSELNGEERNLRNIKRLNDSSSTSTLEDESSTELDSSSSETEVADPIVDGPQFVIIYKDETDVTLTITLDNPEAHGIDALRVSCDDPEAKIQVEGEWKPIAQEADGTRVVNWSSEDPYEKTYNIRTTSLEDLYTFKVVDIRLSGHSTFLSKQTKSNDFGNNKLDIYKMDTDAYELDVVYNTFEEIKFGIKVKDSVNNLSNFKVDGKLPDEEGYWVMNESKNDCEISYDFELENGVKIRRESRRWIGPMEYIFLLLGQPWSNTNTYYGGFSYVLELGSYIEPCLEFRDIPSTERIKLTYNGKYFTEIENQFNIVESIGLLTYDAFKQVNNLVPNSDADYAAEALLWYNSYYPYLIENLENSEIKMTVYNTEFRLDFNFYKDTGNYSVSILSGGN